MASIGETVPEPQLRIARRLHLEGLEDHTPQFLDRTLISDADLILAMSRQHRKSVARLDPTAMRRNFTIREFARLAPLVTFDDVQTLVDQGKEPLAAAVDAVAGKRGLLPPPKFQEELDVIDPYKQGASVYRLSRDELVPAAKTVSDYLTSIQSIYDAESIGGPEGSAVEDAL